MVERATTRPFTRQPTMLSERTFSFISPVGSAHADEELPVLELQQKLAEVDADVPSRIVTRRPTSLVSSPVLPVERIASISPETEVVRRMSTRKPTVQPSRQTTIKESGIDSEVFEDISSLTSTSVEDEPQGDIITESVVEDVTFEAPVERIREATTQGFARQELVQSSSSATSSSQSDIQYV